MGSTRIGKGRKGRPGRGALPVVPPNAYFVAPGGNNASAGSQNAPWATVAFGVSQLIAGQILYLRAGTYVEGLTSCPSGTSWTNVVTIQAYTGETVWLAPTSGAVVLALTTNEQYIVFDGINMDATGTTTGGVVLLECDAGGEAHHIRIKNAELKGTSSQAGTPHVVRATADVAALGGHEFQNLTVYGSGQGEGSHGFYVSTPDTLIEFCEIYDFPGAGVRVQNGVSGARANGTIVRNNFIHDGRATVAGEQHYGIRVDDVTADVEVYNNIVVDIPNDGETSYGIAVAASNVLVVYNTVTRVAGSGGTLVSDTFTDTSGTTLASHIGETGATWTAQTGSGTAVISDANRVRGTSNAHIGYYASGVPASADYDVQAVVRAIDNSQFFGVAGRLVTSTLQKYSWCYHSASGYWVLQYYTAAGAATDLGTFVQSITVGTNYTIKLELRGSALKGYVDGVERVSVSDSTLTAAGRAGIFAFGVSDNTSGWHLDTLTVSESAGVGIDIVSGSGNIVRNNISYANATNYLDSGTGTTANHNITDGTNPLFTNAGGSLALDTDFMIQAGSPAKDAGVVVAGVTTDYVLVERPQSTAPDIGAYERSAEEPQPAGYYVATGGNDAAAGTFAAPWRTLNFAVTQLTAGDTLNVRGGTYVESLILNIPSGTSWANTVRLVAYPGETVTLRPTASAVFVLHFGGTQRYIELDGIDLDGINIIAGNTVRIESGFTGFDAHHIRLKNAEVIGRNGNAAQNILQSGGPETATPGGQGGNEFINLVVHGGGASDFDHGLYLQSPDNLVEGCTIYDVPGAGVHLYSGYGPYLVRATIRNTIVRDLRSTVAGQRHWGILANTGGSHKIYNNLISGIPTNGGTSAGVYIYASTGNELYHNTVYGNAGEGIVVESDTANTIVKNNISYSNAGGNYRNGGTGTVASNNITDGTNPLFVNAGASDFHLQSGSPAINTGVAVSGMTTDFDGIARGNPPEIGAYEKV